MALDDEDMEQGWMENENQLELNVPQEEENLSQGLSVTIRHRVQQAHIV